MQAIEQTGTVDTKPDHLCLTGSCVRRFKSDAAVLLHAFQPINSP